MSSVQANAGRSRARLDPVARDSAVLRRGLIAYVLLIAVVSWSYEIWQIRRDRDAVLEAARMQLATIASAFENHLQAIINDGVGAAEAAVNELRADRFVNGSREQETAVLSRMLTGGDYVRRLFFVTPQTFASAERHQQADQHAETPAWAKELRSAGGSSWIGNPQSGVASEGPLIPIARRIADFGNQPAWAGALFGVEPMQRLYREIPVTHGSVALVSGKGIALMVVPMPPRQMVGVSVADWEIFRQAIRSNDQRIAIEGFNPNYRTRWIYVARRVAGYDLITVAGQDLQAALAPWSQHTTSAVQLGVAITIAMFLLTAVLYRLLLGRYAALRASEERFQLAVDGTSDGIWDWDLRNNNVYYSPRFRQLLGYDATAEFSASIEAMMSRLHPEDRQRLQRALRRHLEDREPLDVQQRLRIRSGEYRWFRARGQAIWDEEGAFRMAGSIGDIHSQIEMQQSLQLAQRNEVSAHEEFSQRLLDAQEQERRRIANELHDSLGQNLSLITNRAQLALQATDASVAVSHMQSIVGITAEAIDEVRSLARNLQPLHIEQLGLVGALTSLLQQTADSSAFKLEYHIDDIDDVIVGAAATHVYRIVQEGLNNVMKHAHATHVAVRVERDLHCVRITMSDDGRGFDANETNFRKSGLGLNSMVERARILRGTITIDSSATEGSRLHVELPISEQLPSDATAEADSL